MNKHFYQQEHAISTPFDNSSNGFNSESVQDAIEEAKATAEGLPRFALVLQYNGNISNGFWIGYSSTIPGDSTPVIVGVNSYLSEFTFSNSNSNADYTLEFYNNGMTAGDLFLSVSKTNTQYFAHYLTTEESFNQGDAIFVKYVDDGTNASDVVVVLYFKAAI